MKEFMTQNEVTAKEKIGWSKEAQCLTLKINWFQKIIDEDVVVYRLKKWLCSQIGRLDGPNDWPVHDNKCQNAGCTKRS